MLYLSPNTRNYSYSITHELTTHELTIRELTFAGLDALEPCVIKLRVAGISALFDPSTAGSATTAFAGFLDRAALRTLTRISRSWSHGVCF